MKEVIQSRFTVLLILMFLAVIFSTDGQAGNLDSVRVHFAYIFFKLSKILLLNLRKAVDINCLPELDVFF